ncbi:RNA-dependent RNA polymerase [Rhizophagus sp. RF1 medium virus]|nr:RNA-dependent RNA polymerase [Rhizophagus sp. RF1 medium virus]
MRLPPFKPDGVIYESYCSLFNLNDIKDVFNAPANFQIMKYEPIFVNSRPRYLYPHDWDYTDGAGAGQSIEVNGVRCFFSDIYSCRWNRFNLNLYSDSVKLVNPKSQTVDMTTLTPEDLMDIDQDNTRIYVFGRLDLSHPYFSLDFPSLESAATKIRPSLYFARDGRRLVVPILASAIGKNYLTYQNIRNVIYGCLDDRDNLPEVYKFNVSWVCQQPFLPQDKDFFSFNQEVGRWCFVATVNENTPLHIKYLTKNLLDQMRKQMTNDSSLRHYQSTELSHLNHEQFANWVVKVKNIKGLHEKTWDKYRLGSDSVIDQYVINYDTAIKEYQKLLGSYVNKERIDIDSNLVDELSGLGSVNEKVKWDRCGDNRDRLPFKDDFYNPDESGRRYSHVFMNPSFKIFGVRLQRLLSMLDCVIDVKHDKYLQDVFSMVYCVAEVSRRFKLLGDFMKKYGSNLTKDWYVYVNLETAIGYKTALPTDEFVHMGGEWIVGDIEHIAPVPNGQLKFYEWLVEGIESTLRLKGKSKIMYEKPIEFDEHGNPMETLDQFSYDVSKQLSYRDYVYGCTWSRRGSSSIKTKLRAEINGKKVKLSETKNTLAIYGDLEKILKDSLDPDRPQWGKAIRKRERGKIRAVLGMDVETYLPMSYIDDIIQPYIIGNELSNLWETNFQRHAKDVDRLILSIEKTKWFIPLDQSGFDHQINNNMLLLTLVIIKSWLLSRVKYKGDVERCIEIIIKRLALTNSEVNVDDKINIPVERGILSGWKWTAFMDTLINIGEVNVALRTCEYYGLVCNYKLDAQGDDDDIIIDDLLTGLVMCEAYRYCNLKINPAKFFIKNNIDEYLRRVYVDGVSLGYPARMFLTFFESNPIRNVPLSEMSELRSVIKNWMDLIRRRSLNNERWVKLVKLMERDILIRVNKNRKISSLSLETIL